MRILPDVFAKQFERFTTEVERVSGTAFVSFGQGLPWDWEYYKEGLHDLALRRLGVETWNRADIGTGKLIDKVIEIIEIDEPALKVRNNLVAWDGRYGPSARSHAGLYKAKGHPNSRLDLDLWFYDFFHGELTDSLAFERFRKSVGSRYDLIAYMYFLRDWTKYMPIAPMTFDRAFALLGIELVTSGHCSWANYSDYNDALRAVQRSLHEVAGLAEARLIDAHSFCWMLVRPELALAPDHDHSRDERDSD